MAVTMRQRITEHAFRADLCLSNYIYDEQEGQRLNPYRHFGLEDYFTAFAVTGIMVGVFKVLALRKGFCEQPHVSSRILLQMGF
jgi:hypothetical protein